MKALRTVLFSALAAFGLATAADVSAQQTSGVARASSGARTGAISQHGSGGPRHWGGGTRHWSGGTRHWGGGGHWSGHRNYWHGSRIGFYFGVPVLWGAAYWGWPYYYDSYYYPRTTVIYRDIERHPASYPDGEMGPATTEVPPSAGAPAQGPLYMNYCESAKAYYPKVTSCPEGWKFVRPAP